MQREDLSPSQPADDPTRVEAEVHVWRFSLDPDDDRLTRLEATLSDDEQARADRYRGPGLRRRFVAGRGVLRELLGYYLGTEPGRVGLVYGLRGKPRLAGREGLTFNLAHSGGQGLCALTMRRELGVDIEQVRPFENAERIIGRYFTPAECDEFLACSVEHRLPAFYRGWTRKEAFLKATGEGLATALDSFEVSLAAAPVDARGSLLLTVEGDREAARRWMLVDVDAGPGFTAALAVEGMLDQVFVGDWDGRDLRSPSLLTGRARPPI